MLGALRDHRTYNHLTWTKFFWKKKKKRTKVGRETLKQGKRKRETSKQGREREEQSYLGYGNFMPPPILSEEEEKRMSKKERGKKSIRKAKGEN
jgi:hypothetical protein